MNERSESHPLSPSARLLAILLMSVALAACGLGSPDSRVRPRHGECRARP